MVNHCSRRQIEFRRIVLLSFCILIFLMSGPPLRGGELKLDRMLENEKLREYFRGRLIGIASSRSPFGHRKADNRLIEYRINLLIEHFAKEVAELLTELQDGMSKARLHYGAVTTADNRVQMQEAKVLWIESLDELQDKAGDLHKKLRFPLYGLESEARSSDFVEPDSALCLFRVEMSLLAEELAEAQTMILAYLSRDEQVVSVGSLIEGNFLIRLDRLRKRAGQLREHVQLLHLDEFPTSPETRGNTGEGRERRCGPAQSMPSFF